MASQKYAITAGLLMTLAACGGGGGGEPMVTVPAPPSNTPEPTPIVTPTPQQGDSAMWAARDDLLATYTDPTVYTALSTIQTSGTVTYDGYLAGQLANTSDGVTDTLIGAMRVDVRFTSSSVQVTGAVDGFVDSDDDALSGELTLSAGSLDRGGNPSSDATLLMSANGTLTDDQGRSLVIGSQLEGDFLGSGHAAMGGEVLGSVRVNGADQDFDGGFIAER